MERKICINHRKWGEAEYWEVIDICGIKFRHRQYGELFKCLEMAEVKVANIPGNLGYKMLIEYMRAAAYFELGINDKVISSAKIFSSYVPEDEFYTKIITGKNPAKITLEVTDIYGETMAMGAAAAFRENDLELFGFFKEKLARFTNPKKANRYNDREWREVEFKYTGLLSYYIGDFCGYLHSIWKPEERDSTTLQYRPFGVIPVKKSPGNLSVGDSAQLGVIVALAMIAAPSAVASNVAERIFDVQKYSESVESSSKAVMAVRALVHCGYPNDARQLIARMPKGNEIKSMGAIYWQLLYEQASIAKMDGDTKTAIMLLVAAIDEIESVRSSISAESSKIGFVGDKQAVYKSLVEIYFQQGDWQSAFQYIERAKARALIDMLSLKNKISPPEAADSKIISLLEKAEYREPPMLTSVEDVQTRSIALAARQELSKSAPELASLISVPTMPLAEISAKLTPQETLVNYFQTGDALYALVLNGDVVKGFKLESTGLEGEVRKFRESLEESDNSVDMQSRKLYMRLIAPLENDLKGKKITFSPHSALHYLPFGALHDGKQYLLEKYSIRIMPSANALAYLKTDKPKKVGKVLALGNPDLNNNSLDLPAAQKEAMQVASLFPASKAMVRKEASKEALKEYGNGFSILHIASHGQFDNQKPLNSGLLLAGKGPDEGRLTVDDLYSMRLDTELVTLSACETGLGKVASGDDVVGLTRGFMYAGARSVVSSLWQVDDAATAKLMTTFYKNLAKNIDLREALRLAQVETKKSYPHPYYWAAFQITGTAN